MSLAGFDGAFVVGHSMAGAIIPRVAEVEPARLAQRLGVAPIDLDCAHNAVLSKPEALANLLSEIASGQGRRRKDPP